MLVFGVHVSILVRIFSPWDWIRRFSLKIFVFNPNAGKQGTEKLQIRTLFTQCWIISAKITLKLWFLKHPLHTCGYIAQTHTPYMWIYGTNTYSINVNIWHKHPLHTCDYMAQIPTPYLSIYGTNTLSIHVVLWHKHPLHTRDFMAQTHIPYMWLYGTNTHSIHVIIWHKHTLHICDYMAQAPTPYMKAEMNK